jgi:hexosaminidase
MREIVDYCTERHITVIPEFDMPGHCSAIIHAYPELSCTGAPLEVKTSQGIYDDILCAGKDGTFEIIFDILSDILDIFPSEYIHIGGDEAPKVRWEECMYCQKRMREEGLKNTETLQGWFTNRIIGFLKSKGRKPIVWNESLKSGVIEKSVLVQRWMDPKNYSSSFTKDGGKIINSDFYHYYCDYPYSMTPVSKTYNYNPVVKGMTASDVVGIEAPIWTEYINNFDYLCYMCFPRFTAAAETGWTDSHNKDYSDFCRRFESYSDILKEIGITPAPAEEWSLNPLKRVTKTLSFFSGLLKKKD